MCCFITYIIPKSIPDEQVQVAFAPEKIRLRIYTPKSIVPGVGIDDQCWIRANGCDCDNPIGSANWDPVEEADPVENSRKKYTRKGWSEAKIKRAISAMQRPTRSAGSEENPTVRIMQRLFANDNLNELKLFWHEYLGDVNTEKVAIADHIECRLENLGSALDKLTENRMLYITTGR